MRARVFVPALKRSIYRQDILFFAYLTRRIDNFCRKILAFESNDFAECVFYRGVIAFDEVPIDELYSNRRFAYNSQPDPATRLALAHADV